MNIGKITVTDGAAYTPAAPTNFQVERAYADSDELTGVYNRRGFYRMSNMLLESPESAGKSCVLILADLG